MKELLTEIETAMKNGPVFVGGMRNFISCYMIGFYYLVTKIDVVFIEAVLFDTGSEKPLPELSSPGELTHVVSFLMEKKTTKMRPFGLKLTIQSGTENTKVEFGFEKCAYHKRNRKVERVLEI